MDTAIKNSKRLIGDYIEWLQFMPFSKATVRTYPVYVKSFFKYLKRKERKIKDVRSIDKNVILRYQAFVQQNSSKKGDVMRRQGFYALKNFFKWTEFASHLNSIANANKEFVENELGVYTVVKQTNGTEERYIMIAGSVDGKQEYRVVNQAYVENVLIGVKPDEQ